MEHCDKCGRDFGGEAEHLAYIIESAPPLISAAKSNRWARVRQKVNEVRDVKHN